MNFSNFMPLYKYSFACSSFYILIIPTLVNVVKIKSLASLVLEKLSVYSTHLCNLSGT